MNMTLTIRRTWMNFRLAAIGIAIDDCLRREAQAQAAISKLIKREMRLRCELAALPAPEHHSHIVQFPESGVAK